jgi:hypothetical protein
MSIQTIKKILKTVYPKGKISVWHCPKPKCDFYSQSVDDAVLHEILSIGQGKHESKLYQRF